MVLNGSVYVEGVVVLLKMVNGVVCLLEVEMFWCCYFVYGVVDDYVGVVFDQEIGFENKVLVVYQQVENFEDDVGDEYGWNRWQDNMGFIIWVFVVNVVEYVVEVVVVGCIVYIVVQELVYEIFGQCLGEKFDDYD